ncbi:nitroreductase family protein [Engelhardtia mirabilis]|uniref:FMN reductase (NADPH) n=1 Tax=Engelhardtia mirabilis TaxID=2528011 RepID=A0A518BJD4_9BACT|nr:FMN reductase (NADPH) [Planctomycetes bacterium Pla133]QDV01417.1 FMN reductase (NADPH) [Planctomycetes bacterium Pla86]
MNPTLELMGGHRSIRAFEPGELPDGDVRAAVAAAQMAASSSNIQGYSLLRIRAQGNRERLVELTGGQAYVRDCGAFFVVCGDDRRHRLLARREGVDHAANLETFLLTTIDASLFAQNLVLAFESQGYGICYIGGLRNRLPEVVDLLEVPEGVYPLYGLCVGVPAQDPTLKPRLSVDAVMHEDRYPTDDQVLAATDEYDERMAAYYTERGKPGHNWSGAIWRRFSKRIREHLNATYTGQGANLE